MNLLDELNDLGVPDSFSNPMSHIAQEANRKVCSGAPHDTCVYCGRLVPLPIKGKCPFCAMNLEADIDEEGGLASF